jgi:KUP system potassium uptake protein
VVPLDGGFKEVHVHLGYMDDSNLPMALEKARKHGLRIDIMSTSFFINRRWFKPSPASAMPRWQNRLYISLTKAATNASDFFRLPTNRVIEIGQQFSI